MTAPTPAASLNLRQGWPLYAGMVVAGAAAVMASASTLAGLAREAGWSGWTPWLLPAVLDVGGNAGGGCWLRLDVPDSPRAFGRVVALAGAAATLLGNAAGYPPEPSGTLLVGQGEVTPQQLIHPAGRGGCATWIWRPRWRCARPRPRPGRRFGAACEGPERDKPGSGWRRRPYAEW
jgi:hypothetical protein